MQTSICERLCKNLKDLGQHETWEFGEKKDATAPINSLQSLLCQMILILMLSILFSLQWLE